MSNPVKHYVSVEPDVHVLTRARVVATSSRIDEVALFAGDNIVGTLSVPSGRGAAVCEQLGLVERRNVVSFADVRREFERALREQS